jgi:hypothetical protein
MLEMLVARGAERSKRTSAAFLSTSIEVESRYSRSICCIRLAKSSLSLLKCTQPGQSIEPLLCSAVPPSNQRRCLPMSR